MIFISGESAISPFDNNASTLEKTPVTVDNRFCSKEPNYLDYLDPRASRRMSRVMKMGIATSLMCLKKTQVELPDAILTATGFGCLDDTATFLNKLSHEDGQLLNPTPFIQSTHNTVAGSIALHLKCHSYNNTFTQRNFSFESALTEASLLLNEKQNINILLGSIDEMIDPVQQIIDHLRETRSSNKNMVPIGEGVTFFMLSNIYSESALTLSFFKTIYQADNDQLKTEFENMISTEGMPDLILLGKNGNFNNDKNYGWIDSQNDIPKINYKIYCGEYPTSSAFAHWLACNILRNNYAEYSNARKILIYNQCDGKNHSFTFIKK